MFKGMQLFLPLLLVIVFALGFLLLKPFDELSKGAPPIEDLAIVGTRLDDAGIHVTVQAAGSEPMSIAQVQVDGAYRSFTQTPDMPIGYLATARIDIPYPWIEGEPHFITFVTNSGVTFEHTIEVAITSPAPHIVKLALAGLFVGIVPIFIGFAFYPALQHFGAAGHQFAMALTAGLLTFLLVDTLGEALEIANQASEGLKADLAVWMSAGLSCLILLALGRRSGKPPEGYALALFISIGIGFHNLGEGVAIGASIAIGEVALASFLILGFFIHNVSEGVAISAPLRKETISARLLAGLALIAGGPAIIGTVAGALAYSPFWTAVAFGIGAGAILQVIIEVVGLILHRAETASAGWLSKPSLAGFVSGIALMYATALFVHG